MSELPDHGVDYPVEFLEQHVRELLRYSQTNITRDPTLGEWYAAAAYDKSLMPDIWLKDPTATGEAAAKAGFRATQQAEQTDDYIENWFERSTESLKAHLYHGAPDSSSAKLLGSTCSMAGLLR